MRDHFAKMRRDKILASSKDGKIRRQDSWDLDYLNRQYMRELIPQDLEKRFEDVFVNLLGISEVGQIQPRAWVEKGNNFSALFSHILVEKQLRGEGLQGGLDWRQRYGALNSNLLGWRSGIPNSIWDRPYLFKVGMREHLTEALERGHIRVCPSSYYSDSALNVAIQDREGVIDLTITASDQAWHLKGAGIVLPDSEKIETVTIRQTESKPFHVWCCSAAYRPEIPANFFGDACLVIKDCKRFSRLFRSALERALPGSTVTEGLVRYVDPLNSKVERYDMPLTKHFRFTYQREYRFVARNVNRQSLEPVFLDIGSMEQYAELYFVRQPDDVGTAV